MDDFRSLTREEFNAHKVLRDPHLESLNLIEERFWFKWGYALGVIAFDNSDHNWSIVVMSKDQDGKYRAVDFNINLSKINDAKRDLRERMKRVKDREVIPQDAPMKPEDIGPMLQELERECAARVQTHAGSVEMPKGIQMCASVIELQKGPNKGFYASLHLRDQRPENSELIAGPFPDIDEAKKMGSKALTVLQEELSKKGHKTHRMA